jgi:hypothetical protein
VHWDLHAFILVIGRNGAVVIMVATLPPVIGIVAKATFDPI